MDDLKDDIKKLISEGELALAFQRFFESGDLGESLKNEVVNLSGQLFSLKNDRLVGILARPDFEARQSQISLGLLHLLEKWLPAGQLSALEQAISRLRFDPDGPVGVVHLVNCDRNRPRKTFRRAFENHREQHFQFYFIGGCPTEMPDSFAERLIYELIEDEKTGQTARVSFQFQEKNDSRVRVEKLPLGVDLTSSRKKFKAYVQKRFQFAETDSFENFIETGVPKLNFDFVASIFTIDEQEWEGDEGEIRDYFQWMIDTFRCPHPDVPTFLFFFVVKIRGLHIEAKRTADQAAILEQLEALCLKNDRTILKEINPVEVADIENWFDGLGIQNPNLVRPVVDALARSLTENERREFDVEACFHMKDVQTMQEKVFDKLKK